MEMNAVNCRSAETFSAEAKFRRQKKWIKESRFSEQSTEEIRRNYVQWRLSNDKKVTKYEIRLFNGTLSFL